MLQVLDKVFMCAVLLLSTVWERASSGAGASEVAAQLMDALAALQFCRMRLSAYALLLQGLLTALVKSPQVPHRPPRAPKNLISNKNNNKAIFLEIKGQKNYMGSSPSCVVRPFFCPF